MAAMELFRVAARMTLDKADFDKGAGEADRKGKTLAENLSGYMEKAKKIITGLFAAAAIKKAASAVWDLAKQTSAAGDRIDKQSQALGMSRRAYQEWDYILGQCGASVDDLGMTMKTMTAAITENSADTAAGLSKLGLSAAQLQNMSAEEQFETLVRAFQQMPEGVEKSQLAIQLFGRNAQSLMPLLNSSSDSIDELRKRAEELGLIMSDEDVDASVAFGDALDDMNKTFTALKMKFGAQLLPGFTKGLIAAANALGRISNAVSKAFKTGDWKEVFSIITEEISNAIPSIIDTIVNALNGMFENADKIVDLAVSIVTGLASGLEKAMPKLAAKLPQILESVKKGFLSVAKSLGNSAIDVINSVFGLNIPHIDEIQFPTWPQVEKAATDMWNAIKAKLKEVMIFIFGEDDKGGIKWPSASEIWDKVKTGANILWNGLQSLLSTVFKFVFGEDADGNIQWPKPEEIWKKVEGGFNTLWKGIQDSAKAVMKLLFGETPDGGIDWGNAAALWNKVKGGFDTLWQGIKSSAAGLMKLVFGETDDGGIDWQGGWAKVGDGFRKLWEGENGEGGIKGAAQNLMKLIFGEDEDGNIDWQGGWNKVKDGFVKLWEGEDGKGGIKGAAEGLMKLVFGETEDGSIDWKGGWEKVQAGFTHFWQGEDGHGGIKGAAESMMKLLFGETEDGGIAWPSPDELWEKGRKLFEDFWAGIKGLAEKAMTLLFGSAEGGGIGFESPEKVWSAISEKFTLFWEGSDGNGGIKGLIQGAASWVLGLFGFPKETTEEIVEFFGKWWSAVGAELQTAASWVLGLFGFAEPTDYLNHFKEWWEGKDGTGGLKGMITQVADWVLGVFGLPDVAEIKEQFRVWWEGENGDGGVKAEIKSIANLVLDTLGLPDVEETIKQINDWWEGIKQKINLAVGFTLLPTEGASEQTEGLHPPSAQGIMHGLFGLGGNPALTDALLYGTPSYSNAKGLDYVPYDNYLARLHRGEAILTETQNRQRQGNQGIDMNALNRAVASAVASAVSNIQINMDGKAVANAVTEQVSRNIYQEQLGRRFVPV